MDLFIYLIGALRRTPEHLLSQYYGIGVGWRGQIRELTTIFRWSNTKPHHIFWHRSFPLQP